MHKHQKKGLLNKESKSSVLWELGRLLENMKDMPKFLLMENVPGLIYSHNEEYQLWIETLKELGYTTYTWITNAADHGSLQIRKRTFALSILGKSPFKNEDDFTNKMEIIREARKQLYWNETRINKKTNGKDNQNACEASDALKNKKKKVYESIFDLDNSRFPEEAKRVVLRDTPSRNQIVELNENLNANEDKDYRIKTVTTKVDRKNTVGLIEWKIPEDNQLPWRYITEREAFKIQGFSDEDYEAVESYLKPYKKRQDTLYRLARNSIDIRPLETIFTFIYLINAGLIKEIKGEK